MREILFRGKRLDNGDWVEGTYLHLNVGKDYICPGTIWIGTLQPCKYEVDPDTVGQYTGLTDKNGKKIFEGDIFRFADEIWESYYTSCGTEYNSWETENYGVVGFSEELAQYDFVGYKYHENSVDADLHENRDLVFAEFVSGLEVIGNIHDNPELLKEGE